MDWSSSLPFQGTILVPRVRTRKLPDGDIRKYFPWKLQPSRRNGLPEASEALRASMNLNGISPWNEL